MRTAGEPIVSCPYNPEHKMRHSKLIWHIGKGCKDKELYEHLYNVCPYNAMHIVKKEVLDDHIKVCADKTKYERLTQEEELTQALEKQLTGLDEETKMGENKENVWFPTLSIQNQYEIKDWYHESYTNNQSTTKTNWDLTDKNAWGDEVKTSWGDGQQSSWDTKPTSSWEIKPQTMMEGEVQTTWGCATQSAWADQSQNVLRHESKDTWKDVEQTKMDLEEQV